MYQHRGKNSSTLRGGFQELGWAILMEPEPVLNPGGLHLPDLSPSSGLVSIKDLG